MNDFISPVTPSQVPVNENACLIYRLALAARRSPANLFVAERIAFARPVAREVPPELHRLAARGLEYAWFREVSFAGESAVVTIVRASSHHQQLYTA